MRRPEAGAVVLRSALPLLLLALLASGRALAEDFPPLALEWKAPRGCPTANEVRARVRALAGPLETSGAPIRASATISREARGRLRLRLLVEGHDRVGERNIEGRSCDDLAASAAVALALLMRAGDASSANEPRAAEASSSAGAVGKEEPPRSERAAEPSPLAPPPSAPTLPAAQALVPRTADARVGTGRVRAIAQLPIAAVARGPLRGVSFGAGLAVGAEVGRYRLTAEGRAWLPERMTTRREFERYRVDVIRFTSGLRACSAFSWSSVDLAPCAMVAIEHLAARGSGPNIASRTAKTTWIAPGLGAQLRFQAARRLRIAGGLDVQLHTSRPKIAIGGVGAVEQLSLFGVLGTLGLEWIL